MWDYFSHTLRHESRYHISKHVEKVGMQLMQKVGEYNGQDQAELPLGQSRYQKT